MIDGDDPDMSITEDLEYGLVIEVESG